MALALLPSYEEAVSGGDWLGLVAPWAALQDYVALCRVCRRFYGQFAPRLWNDPLQTIRLLGLHPNDDLDWLAYFVTRHARVVRPCTRELVMSLDFRGCAADVSTAVAQTDAHSFSQLIQLVAVLFPSARCVLLGGNGGYDPADLGRLIEPGRYPEDGAVSMPLMLDMSCCGLPLPNHFFHASYWRQLVYLDMSDLPGSLKGLAKTGTFSQGALSNLRILKLRGRELDEAALAPVMQYAEERIWSLDVRRNRLTDGAVCRLFGPLFGRDDLAAGTCRFEEEGRLAACKDDGPSEAASPHRTSLGWSSYIDESASSATFSHPDRYLADAPVYDVRGQHRLVGNEPLRSDRPDDVKAVLAGGVGQPAPDWHSIRDIDLCQPPSSLTHIHLSDNPDVTVEGIEALFRMSRGHIRYFDCASLLVMPAAADLHDRPSWQLVGILGRSHLFRPVFASNLQSLRIHHSLATQIPTLLDASRSPVEALLYAETTLRTVAEAVYPQAFVPDLNPRVQSLTLTCLPRISSGPLIDKLIGLLLAAHDQEERIRRTSASVTHRGPILLRGLRHIRLEFEPYPHDDDRTSTTLDTWDAQALLNAGPDDFSFFEDATEQSSSQAAGISSALQGVHKDATRGKPIVDGEEGESGKHGKNSVHGHDSQKHTGRSCPSGSGNYAKERRDAEAAMGASSDRLAHYPLPGAFDAYSEFVRDAVYADVDTTGHSRSVSVSVWVGSGVVRGDGDVGSVVKAYMTNLAWPSLRRHIRPATPDQTKAGVPVGVCVYNAAWDAILWTPGRLGISSDGGDGGGSGTIGGGNGLQDERGCEAGGVRLAAMGHSTADGTTSGLTGIEGMRDVVDAIRQFRRQTKATYSSRPGHADGQHGRQRQGDDEPAPRPATHCHWSGVLEVLGS